jgi:hypothetical protein
MGKCSVKPLTTAPVEAGDFTDVMPEFGRTQDVEKYFGIKRGTLYNLLDQGKIKGAVLRQAGCLKGVRLWHMASVREYIFTQMEGPQNSLAQGGLKPPLIRKERK